MVYFPDEKLGKKIVDEAERRKVSLEEVVKELQELRRRVEELERKVK